MALDVDKELKIYFIIGVIVLLIYGLWLFISPESYWALTGAPYFSPTTARIIGAIYIAWAIIVIMLYKEIDNWEKIESWMLFAVLSNLLTLIASIISLVVYNIPLGSGIIGMILNIFFVIVGIHIIMQKRK